MRAIPKSNGTIDLKFSQTDLNKLRTARAVVDFIKRNTLDIGSAQFKQADNAKTALAVLIAAVQLQVTGSESTPAQESRHDDDTPTERPDEKDMADAGSH